MNEFRLRALLKDALKNKINEDDLFTLVLKNLETNDYDSALILAKQCLHITDSIERRIALTSLISVCSHKNDNITNQFLNLAYGC